LTTVTLADLGWSAHFQTQISETDNALVAHRVTGVRRSTIETVSVSDPHRFEVPPGMTTGDFAVGDWVLAESGAPHVARRLEPKSLLQRRSAGTDVRTQRMAANVDTLGIVTACNDDFNVARLERYLALAASSDVLPLIILTRADLVPDAAAFARQAQALSPLVAAVTLDARDPEEVQSLAPWCRGGQTLALMGSSGVGKTTLTNGLTGADLATQDIRSDDAKGRHTSTARHMLQTRFGGWLIDTPGMRALRLADAGEGIDSVFSDISDLVQHCQFSDCHHESEPGCAVQAAIATGALDADRVERWRKLQLEDARNSETIAESRRRSRSLQKMYRQGQSRGRNKRNL